MINNPTSTFAATILLLSAVAAYKLIIYPAFISPLAKIPTANRLASFTSAWILWIRYTQKENRTVRAAHDKYGPVVRLGPREISINCVDDGIRIVYGKGFEKTGFYSIFANCDGVRNMFSTLESKPHSIKKRRISNIYSKSYLQGSEDLKVITATILYQRMLPLIADVARTGQPMDVLRFYSAAAMDAATAFFFGLPNSANLLQDLDARQRWIDMYSTSRPRDFMFFLQEIPSFTSWLAKIGLHLVPKSRLSSNDQVNAWCLDMCDSAEDTITSTLEGNKVEPGNVPVVYMQLKKATEKEGMEQGTEIRQDASRVKEIPGTAGRTLSTVRSRQQLEIASELLDHFVASQDTLPITLTYTTWELSRHPSVQESLRRELLTLPDALVYPNPNGTIPPAKSVDALPLLHAVLMETLRLHPTVPGGQPRISPPDSQVNLGGFSDIPSGTRVSASACVLHRNPDVFPDPESWRPERWLPTHKIQKESDQKERWFWGFGSGGRMCIGSNFAMQMMKFILAAIYTNFTTTIVDDEGIEQMDGYIGAPKGDKLILRFHPLAS